MNKPCITLLESAGTGVIIEYPTGVVYANQVGGTLCRLPTLEGAFAPFRNYVLTPSQEFASPENHLLDYFKGPKYRGTGAIGGIDDEDGDYIDDVLAKAGVDGWIRVDRKRLNESCEAWVFVQVLADINVCSGFGPYPRRGVLTWCNSD